MHDQYATIQLTIEQVQNALSDVNRYYCSRALGHEPSLRELLVYYINNGYHINLREVDVEPLFV